ncbi:MAG: hypothetical protein OXC07_03640 [Kistimonas sp.]|nr:hypothetical protein [Kistimonas sp.]
MLVAFTSQGNLFVAFASQGNLFVAFTSQGNLFVAFTSQGNLFVAFKGFTTPETDKATQALLYGFSALFVGPPLRLRCLAAVRP